MSDRLDRLRQCMAGAGMDAVVLVHPRDVLYYAGTARPAVLLVGPQQVVLFARRGLDLVRREATVGQIEAGGGFGRVAKALRSQGLEAGRLGVEMDVVPARLAQRMQGVFSGWTLADASPLILAQRMVKDAREVESIRHAAQVADAGHDALAGVLRPGLTELALAAEVEAAMRRAGHEGYQPLRNPGARGGGVLLASGEHMTVRGGHGLVVTGAGLSPGTPYGPSRRSVCPGDLVLLDIGSTYDGYTADESRTFVVGRASPAQRALFDLTLQVEEEVLSALRPGAPVAEVYAAAEAIVARGAPPHFAPGGLSLPGFVGHGVGLEIDEPPVLWAGDEARVEAGMTLAVEVEVSATAVGLMTKMEDTVVVESGGARLLTAAPRRLIEVSLAKG